jgi:hypothetical protein
MIPLAELTNFAVSGISSISSSANYLKTETAFMHSFEGEGVDAYLNMLCVRSPGLIKDQLFPVSISKAAIKFGGLFGAGIGLVSELSKIGFAYAHNEKIASLLPKALCNVCNDSVSGVFGTWGTVGTVSQVSAWLGATAVGGIPAFAIISGLIVGLGFSLGSTYILNNVENIFLPRSS